MILQNVVTEFLPYAFQLLAQLVELNRPPIAPNYMEIFKLLLIPESWKRSSNVPALVRLLEAFLQKVPHKISQEGRLARVLGIFNMLVSSPRSDELGFYVLNTVIDNLEYGVIDPYVTHIWNALFVRLQNNRTVKFVKSLVIFMSLFLVKHGPAALVDTMNTIQPTIFRTIVEQFWIPNLKLITGAIEFKLTAVASTRLICESPVLLDPSAVGVWGKMLDSIVTSFSRPEEDRVEEEQEMPRYCRKCGLYSDIRQSLQCWKERRGSSKGHKGSKGILSSIIGKDFCHFPWEVPSNYQ
ncbi:hypothetical protein LWI29_032066 [Acer saccharum]|uniref:Exportin-2 C-terminal domain-containing protein n=1 Tax=Acer saccharum TaxID=4024 RepID=A0AA39SP39_ACESA|nr:hypothetical protein LWI29_032066 [Acer saccharum]